MNIVSATRELQTFLAGCQEIINREFAKNYPNNTIPTIGIDFGKRYVRVFRQDGVSRSAHCFIDTTNGDVLKADGWKGPAKGARGNIFDAKNGLSYMTWTGTALIRRQHEAEQRPQEFQMMDDLNAMPKFPDAGTPFDAIHFVHSHGGWFAECPTTGFGYWYKTLREAVRRWRVTITEYRHGVWVAIPLPQSPIPSVDECWARR